MGDFVQDLQETLSTLSHFGLKLNPLKCSFGVAGAKFLGYQVSRHGLSVNPDKVQGILEMRSPRTIKKVQKLTGSIAALSRFLSQAAEKQLLFFRTLRRIKKFGWTTDCEEAFKQLKAHLVNLPTLSTHAPGEVLYLYVAASEETISSVLVLE